MKLDFLSMLLEASPQTYTFKELDAGGFMDAGFSPFPVEVEYLNLGTDPTAPHQVEIELRSIKTAAATTQEPDGKPPKTWPKGSDVTKMPGWDDSVESYILELLADRV